MDKKTSFSVRKRLLISAGFFSLLFLITILSAPVHPDDYEMKQVVLAADPVFEKRLDGKTYDYEILLFFRGDTTKYRLEGADLEFANREGIRNDLKAGDTLTISWHHVFVCQLEKDGKAYADVWKAYNSGKANDQFMGWFSVAGIVVCMGCFLLSRAGRKNTGWWCLGILLLAGIVLWCVFQAQVSDTSGYQGFQ